MTTKELTGTIGMNVAGTKETIEITPKEGTTFATIELSGTCANAGLYKLTEVVYAQAKNATGAFSFFQEPSVSHAIQEDAGTFTSLKFGVNGAFLNGSFSGTTAGRWAGKEK